MFSRYTINTVNILLLQPKTFPQYSLHIVHYLFTACITCCRFFFFFFSMTYIRQPFIYNLFPAFQMSTKHLYNLFLVFQTCFLLLKCQQNIYISSIIAQDNISCSQKIIHQNIFFQSEFTIKSQETTIHTIICNLYFCNLSTFI